MALRAPLRRLALWPRLAAAVTLGFLALFAVFAVLALRAISESTERILDERLVIAKMAARDMDRLLSRALGELERTSEFAAFDPSARSLGAEEHLLTHAHAGLGTGWLSVLLADRRGRVILARPARPRLRVSARSHVREVLRTRRRVVSSPFLEPLTRRPTVAVAVPVLNADRSVRSALVGVLDVSSPDVVAPLVQSRSLGRTGHAELVSRGGVVIASTERSFLQPGEHLPFYRRMLRGRAAGVETVPYTPSHSVKERGERHVMAFAPLRTVPWAIAVGGNESETFAPVSGLRATLLVAGAAALTILLALTLLAARLLVRPVRTLTRAAGEMASGNLERPIEAGAGGEIGALAESLDAMRLQLRSSLEQVRRWGSRLEQKVKERTEELSQRNRQFAAVAAVASAGAQGKDLDEVLARSLDALLEHTSTETAAVRLVEGNRLAVALTRGERDGLACLERAVGPGDCPCAVVAASGEPLDLTDRERERFQPACRAASSKALTILPLESPKERLGVLCLLRAGDEPRDAEERQVLVAISEQIAVAVESIRLLDELRSLEGQRELQRLRAELVSTVSHELRTPLGVIKGYATTLLRQDLDALDRHTRREFLEAIDEETGNLERMVDDLLDTSRLRAGRIDLSLVPLDLRELLVAVAGKLRPGLEHTGHELAVDGNDERLPVLADGLRVQQVLSNLLDNAARYSDAGTRIRLAARRDDGHALVSIADEGDGVPEPEQETIFEPFYRGESPRRRGVRGAGLGLAICRGLVEAHGGRIWVESSAGGSAFLFVLPLTEGVEAGR